MAGADDAIKLTQFLTGIIGGFSEAAHKSRQEQEANQLRLLSILASNPNISVSPVAPTDVQTQGNLLGALFGANRYTTAGGAPAFRVGQSYVTAQEAPPIPIPDFLKDTPSSYGGAGVPGPPVRPFNVPGGTVQPSTPPPGTTAPTPGATPAPPTTAPQTARAPQATGPEPEARAARARQAYARLAPDLRAQIDAAVDEAARLYPNVPRERLLALIGIESGFNPEAVSPAGAIGLTQLMPDTAAALGVDDPRDVRQNILGGAKYLSQQIQAFKDPTHALAAYNAGPGRVQEYKGVPPFRETQAYVPAVQTAENLFAGPGAVAARRPTAAGEAPEVPSAPTAPRLELPTPRGPEEFINEAQRNVYRTLAPQLRNTVQGQQRLGTALNEAVQRGTLRAERELRTARAEAERIKRERQVHSYEVLNALDQVQDTQQLKSVLDYMAQHPEPDHLRDSVNVLARTPSGQLTEMMAKLYPQLLAANYSQEQIRFAWKVFEKKAELPGVIAEEEAKIKARADLKPYEQARALPGEVRETAAKEEARLKIQRAQYAPLVETVTAQPGTFHNLPAEAKASILPDLVKRGVTADQLEAPGIAEQRSLAIQKARLDLEKTQREKAGVQFTPLEVQENALKLRAAIRQEPKFKIAQEITSGYGNIKVGAQLDNSAGDLAIVNGYAKILDPTGIVHPSEFRTVEEAQGFFQRLGVLPKKYLQGDRLAPETRKNFLAAAQKLAEEKYRNAVAEIEPVYKPRAQGLGVNFEEIFPNPFTTEKPAQQPPATAGAAAEAPAATQAPASIPAIPQGMQPGQTLTLPNGTIIRRKE